MKNGKIELVSFSFKRGLPAAVDMVFDVRFLKNPFYEAGLAHLSGLDDKAAAYIETDKDFAAFFSKLTALLETALPRYFSEERTKITIAIGCTGGRHRSVRVVQKLADFLQRRGYKVEACHRDLKA